MRPPQRRRKPTKRSSDGQPPEKRPKSTDRQLKRTETRRGGPSHAASTHVNVHDSTQTNTVSACNNDADVSSGHASGNPTARHLISTRPVGDVQGHSTPPVAADEVLYQRTDDQPSAAASNQAQSGQNVGMLQNPGTPHMSTGMFSTSSYGLSNNHLSEGENVDIAGGLQIHNSPAYTPSMYDSVGAHIPLKIKEKIWAGEYLEFSLLLKSAKELVYDPQFNGELTIKGGQLTVAPQKPSSINNIHAWTSAFMIFMGIMLEKWPNKGQEYLKYMYNVRLAAERGLGTGWVLYDEQYRLRKVRSPFSSWGEVDTAD